MLFGIVLVFAIAESDVPIDPKAEEIFRKARAFVAGATYPPHLSYHVTVSSESGPGSGNSRTYDSAYDTSDGTVYTHSISEEENARPFRPRGINLVVGLSASTSTGSTGTAVQINRPGDEPDIIGVPMLSPTYTFGLSQDATTPTKLAPAPYPVIAVSSATTRAYVANYVDDETVNGEACAHLRLMPTRDPGRFRLRDLWVASDGAPLQLSKHGNFTSKPWNGIDWTVTYRRDGSAFYIEREATQQSVRIDRYRRGYVEVNFVGIAPEDRHEFFHLNITPNNAFREP